MFSNKILFLSAVCLLSLSCGEFLGAESSRMVLGGKAGWPELSRMQGVVKAEGRFGWESVMLATNARSTDSATDILLNFEDDDFTDAAGNYTVSQNNMLTSPNAKMGKSSALSRGNGGIRLTGKPGSLFGTSGVTGSFLIEFWLNPSIAENGEIVLSWRSSRTVGNYPLYQMISASFERNHLQWNFTNVFNGYTENGGNVSLQSYRTIIPKVWSHHVVSYDDTTGLLEYSIDGSLEALRYVTTNGHESGGSIYTPQLGVPADLDLCPQFTGFIDDFRIQRLPAGNGNLNAGYDTYRSEGGRFETQPILISQGARINRIDALITEPDETAVVLYVRSGDNFYDWDLNPPEWQIVSNHEALKDIHGMYFQLAAELFPDGSGSRSPSVTEIVIDYTEVPQPLPPFSIYAQAGDGEVTLTWSFSVDNTVGGYYVYYGDRPGEYLGREAAQGESPLKVGNTTSVTLTGLKNGKIYYFAVAAYSSIEDKIMGELSREVNARPQKSKNNVR